MLFREFVKRWGLHHIPPAVGIFLLVGLPLGWNAGWAAAVFAYLWKEVAENRMRNPGKGPFSGWTEWPTLEWFHFTAPVAAVTLLRIPIG